MSLLDPARLALETAPTFGAMLKVGVRSSLPLTRVRRAPGPDKIMAFRVAPASARLLDQYLGWSGAPSERYDGILPPHFCSHWAMGPLATLAGQVPYDVRSVLNQGLRLQIKAPIRRGETIHLRGNLQGVEREASRVRIHTRVVASTATQREAVIIDNYASIPLGGKRDKAAATQTQEPQFETIGRWSAGPNDGLHFGLLTGDYNPIHTLWPVGRRSRFGGCILQGFGSLARTYEAIRDADFDIADIEVRFVKPLLLPNPLLEVQLADTVDAQGRLPFRLRSQDGSVHLAGSFVAR